MSTRRVNAAAETEDAGSEDFGAINVISDSSTEGSQSQTRLVKHIPTRILG